MFESDGGKITLDFEVKRVRSSATQGGVKVYCNGEFITDFGDEMELIKPGQKYYGPICGGWASTTPDCKFIYATLFHQYDDIYHISEGVRRILTTKQAIEEANAKTGEEKNNG